MLQERVKEEYNYFLNKTLGLPLVQRVYCFFWMWCFCCDKVSACISSAASSVGASAIAVPWGHETCESQSLILWGYKQPDFSAQDSGRMLQKVTKHFQMLLSNVFGGLQ